MLSINLDDLFGDHLYIDKPYGNLEPVKYDGILSTGGFNELEMSLTAMRAFLDNEICS